MEEDFAAGPRILEGVWLLIHALDLSNPTVPAAAREAFDRWVDVGGYGRRLLFGRLRSEEIGRAEGDAAEHARVGQ